MRSLEDEKVGHVNLVYEYSNSDMMFSKMLEVTKLSQFIPTLFKEVIEIFV